MRALSRALPAALAAGGALLALLLPWGASRAEILEEIVARVNDQVIVRSELQTRRGQVARQLADTMQGDELEQALAEAQDSLLLNMINEELLVQQARLNFDMEKYFDNLKNEFKRNNDITTDSQLNELLRGEGLTMDEFRRILLRSNVPSDVLQFEVARQLAVSPEEIQAYYEQHRDEFSTPGAVTLREIVILEEGRSRDEARSLADQVVARARGGEEFAALAAELSEAPSADDGGLVGPFAAGELAPALEELAFSLPPGQVAEPVATSYGFYILMVESRTEAEVAPLSQVRSQIDGAVRQEKYSRDVAAFLGKLWGTNQIVVNPRYATGALAEGGPYATLEEILGGEEPLGPQETAAVETPTPPAP
jgi:peptidyl-prolyl cis-trans isomerase SurA